MKAAFIVSTMLIASAALAAEPQDGAQTVTFDHFTAEQRATRKVAVRPGQYFIVDILNLHEEYTVSWEPYRTPDEQLSFMGKQDDSKLAEAAEVEGVTLFRAKATTGSRQAIPHEKNVGAYVVTIAGPERNLWTPNKGISEGDLQIPAKEALAKTDPEERKKAIHALFDANGTTHKVGPSSLVIIVGEKPWHTVVSGGFVVSLLTDEVYVAKPGAAGSANQILIRDKGLEDEASVGLATMIHVYKDHWRIPGAFSLGLGITTGSDFALFPGLSWRLGDEAAITIGLAIGKTATRPAGLGENDAITDVNALNHLPKHTTTGAFVGISYAFIGNREKDIVDRFAMVKPADTKPADTK